MPMSGRPLPEMSRIANNVETGEYSGVDPIQHKWENPQSAPQILAQPPFLGDQAKHREVNAYCTVYGGRAIMQKGMVYFKSIFPNPVVAILSQTQQNMCSRLT